MIFLYLPTESNPKKMKITTLIENDLSPNADNLKAEFGLSLYIETAHNKILLDTGSSGKFLDNARRLGIEPKNIDTVVISHSHFDHTGGLKRFLKENDIAKVYISENVQQMHYYRPLSFLKKYIGIDQEMLEENKDRFSFINNNIILGNGMKIITKIEHKFKLPSDSKNLFAKNNNRLEHDKFDHELILTVTDGNKLFIFTGCSHNGILNMVETVKNREQNKEVYVVGGFHMFNPITRGMIEKKQDVINIANVFNNDTEIKNVITGHCTGKKAYSILGSVLGDKLLPMHTGSVFSF